jgi:energy-coupling factor transporter ATP-binding protein EcfA2
MPKENNMMTLSPFSDTRFEYEIRHLYYIQEDLYSTLQRTKPCYLIGSRGTGKTTLLRSLSWRERLNNEGLRKQLGKTIFSEFIGIYIKLPDIQLDAISFWLKDEPDVLRRSIYSRYLELIQLQEIFDAVSELESVGQLKYSATAEQQATKGLIREFGGELFLRGLHTRPPVSFAELSNSTRSLRRYIEKASQQYSSASEVQEAIGSPSQLGALSREVAARLTQVISPTSGQGEIYFKVCFDEAETLDPFGVQILATWVRLSTQPLFHVISFVSKPESLSETLLPNLTVQSADVEILELDSIKDKQFRSFAEGVTNLRIKEFARRSDNTALESIPPFNTERIFGKLNLNFLLEDSLRDSVSPFAQELLRDASQSIGEEFGVLDRNRRGDDSALPIYETYLERRTNRAVPTDDVPKWSKRKASSQLTRKAMVGAYLSIMEDLRTQPKYAYADMILQLSDSCIRDFLNNLEYIFRESKMSLPQFLNAGKIKPSIQNSGLIASSKAKVKSLPTHGVNNPSCTAKLVTGLGKVTHMLQSTSQDGVRHLKTTERGIFQLSTAVGGTSTARAVELIIDAAEAGFLKVVESDELSIRFRVHTSLAPAFGFSYRGAYYPVNIQTQEIICIADASDDKDIEKIAAFLFEKLDGSRTDDLFSKVEI